MACKISFSRQDFGIICGQFPFGDIVLNSKIPIQLTNQPESKERSLQIVIMSRERTNPTHPAKSHRSESAHDRELRSPHQAGAVTRIVIWAEQT
jgi:hypothetical protein